jgi:histidyl-tRNA synthetase
MQCDIDILGEPTILAEIELITATTTLLGKIGFEKFTIRLNNRKMLKAMAAYSGFEEKDYDSVFITLDKMDKIGLEGVNEELVAQGYSKESVDKYLELFDKVTPDIAGVNFLKDTLGDFLEDGVAEDLETIMTSVDAVKSADFKIVFDPTLVRGMSYYTGPIFEISMDEYGGSVGGGGRYDEMIGKFTGQNTPACGFSIGFERIVMLLLEREYQVPTGGDKVAFLVEKNMPTEKMLEVLKEAKKQRENGTQVNIAIMKKNKKFQKEQMEKEGYSQFKEFFADRL